MNAGRSCCYSYTTMSLSRLQQLNDLTWHQHKPAAVDDNSALWRQLRVYCFDTALPDDHTVAK
jgi:hypothetical protein